MEGMLLQNKMLENVERDITGQRCPVKSCSIFAFGVGYFYSNLHMVGARLISVISAYL